MSRKLKIRFLLQIVLLTGGIGASDALANYTFTTFDDPLAVATGVGQGTAPLANSGKNVVGYYTAANDLDAGFLYNGGTFTNLSDPLTPAGGFTVPSGIDGNTIVGTYGLGHVSHGFTYNILTASFTTLPDPTGSAPNTAEAAGIDGNTVVGGYEDSGGKTHGFVYNLTTSQFTTLDDPENGGTTFLYDASGTQIVGGNGDGTVFGVAQGFLYDTVTQKFTQLNYPGASDTTASGLSGGLAVGAYADAGGGHGYFYNGGSYTALNDPLASYGLNFLGTSFVGGTYGEGIDGNNVVGVYTDSNGYLNGFAVTVPEPGMVSSLCAMTGIATVRRRRDRHAVELR